MDLSDFISSFFCLYNYSPDSTAQYMPMPLGVPQTAFSMPISSFTPRPSVLGAMPPPPATALHKDDHADDEDYDS